MHIKELITSIKNRQFKPLYLLHGEEPYYIDQISKLLESTVLSNHEKGFNQTVLYGRDTDFVHIVNMAKHFPMMSSYRLILIKEAQELKWTKTPEDNSKNQDLFLSYLENPSPSTILVLCYKYKKFEKNKKVYKAIHKHGLVFESAEIYPDQVATWIENFLGEKKYRIQAQACILLAEYLGNKLSKIANELEKLILNIPPSQEISIDDVQKNIGISKEYHVFELQTAIAHNNLLKANQIIHYFAKNPKSNPIILVLGSLTSYFTKLLLYHYTNDKSPQNLAKALGVHPFFIKDYALAGQNYSKHRIFEIIADLRITDLKTKGTDATGHVNDWEWMKELLFKIMH